MSSSELQKISAENGHPLAQSGKEAPSVPATFVPPPEEQIPEYDETAVVPIMGLGEPQTGVFTSSTKEITLRLFEQRPNEETDVPAYGRGATIKGEASLVVGTLKGIKQGSARQVTLKLTAFIRLDLFDGFPSQHNFVEKEIVLWTKTKESKTPPDNLPFEIPFPTDESAGMSLPPSYITPFGETSSLQAKIIYRLEVTVKTKVLGVESSATMQQDINYYPRSAPPEALETDYQNFNPSGNWIETKRIVNAKAGSGLEPIQCRFWIPASRVFGITQTIPFHVQLSGRKPAIDEFITEFNEAGTAKAESKRVATKEQKWRLKVQILRKITVQPQPDNKDADISSREVPMGAALVRPMTCIEGTDGIWTLDMGGELQCQKNFKTPAIVMGGLTEKDFIVLEIQPENRGLVGRRVAFPISLVTDVNTDETTVLVVYPFSHKLKGALIAGICYGCVIS